MNNFAYVYNLAGITFRKAEGALDDVIVRQHDRLLLVPEPENKFDEDAVRIVNEEGKFLGYVPKALVDVKAAAHNDEAVVSNRVVRALYKDETGAYNTSGIGELCSVRLMTHVGSNFRGHIDGDRIYIKDGRQYLGITTLLTRVSRSWRYEYHRVVDKWGSLDKFEQMLNERADIGTNIHRHIDDYIKAYMKGNEYEHSDEVPKYVIRMITESLAKMHAEVVVYDDVLELAGTCDLYCLCNGLPTVIDWKTGSEWITHKMQLGFYAHAGKKILDNTIVSGACVYTKKGTAKWYNEIQLHEAYEAVRALAVAHRYSDTIGIATTGSDIQFIEPEKVNEAE